MFGHHATVVDGLDIFMALLAHTFSFGGIVSKILDFFDKHLDVIANEPVLVIVDDVSVADHVGDYTWLAQIHGFKQGKWHTFPS